MDFYSIVAHQDFQQRHGPFAESVWSRAEFLSLADVDAEVIADSIRDTYESATAFNEAVARTSSTIALDLPSSFDGIKKWVAAVERLPTIEEDGLLPSLGAFAPAEIDLATKLATERLELVSHPFAELPSGDPEAIAQLAPQVQNAGVLDLSPAEIVQRGSRMELGRKSLIESLEVFARLTTAFRAPAEPDVSAARIKRRALHYLSRRRTPSCLFRLTVRTECPAYAPVNAANIR
jgi:hypothetical protein